MGTKHYQIRRLARAYYYAKEKLVESGYDKEIDWQYDVSLEKIDERTFLREASWVVLNSGMREAVIRSKYPLISKAFYNWESAKLIVKYKSKCRHESLRIFNNSRKIDAIISIAESVASIGIDRIKLDVQSGGIEYLMKFPFIGKITSFHLAKNIGLPTSKPDRHLTRISHQLGYTDSDALCEDIASVTDEPLPVIDLVIWRFAVLNTALVQRFTSSVGLSVRLADTQLFQQRGALRAQ